MNNITTDADVVFNEFCKFETKEMKRTLTNALKSVSRQLVKESKQSLKSNVKNTTKQNPKFNDTLISGIRGTRVWENDNGDICTKVRIDSNRKSGSGSYRLAILEKGNYKTKPRYAYTKNPNGHKKAYRGNISATNFFATANERFNSTYDSRMREAFDKAVEKINNKKFGK